MTYLYQSLGATASSIQPGVTCRTEGATSRYGTSGAQHLVCRGGKWELTSGSAPSKVYAEGSLRVRRDHRSDPPQEIESIYLNDQWVGLGEKMTVYDAQAKAHRTLGYVCRARAGKEGLPFSTVPGCVEAIRPTKGHLILMESYLHRYFDKLKKAAPGTPPGTPPGGSPPGIFGSTNALLFVGLALGGAAVVISLMKKKKSS